MKTQIKTPVLVIAVIAVLGVVVAWGLKTAGGAGNLDQGQVQYTPGKPPWLETDASKRGPGGAPANGLPVGAPSINNTVK